MKILVLGVSGMLGSAVMRTLSQNTKYEVWGSARTTDIKKYFSSDLNAYILTGIDVENADSLTLLLAQVRPKIVVNCIGLVKQLSDSGNPLHALPINALLPHRLAHMCSLIDARLIHISTDCVFAGDKGMYKETDLSDAEDLYGRSKFLGEVDYLHAITLRTSIIGHELRTSHGLVDWFLAQSESVNGYTNAIFSGLPTCELARVIDKFIIPKPNMRGVYHVAAQPISKYDLLKLVNEAYCKNLMINADGRLKINRSLNSTRFQDATGYIAPSWTQLVDQMRASQ